MPLEEPSWWYGDGSSLTERLLAPVSDIYGSALERRFARAEPYRSALPVICIGNFTAGGTGKTPLTRFIIDLMANRGKVAASLSRGYGGRLPGPVWVDAERHTAGDVGDEPLLIARGLQETGAREKGARVMVARDRKAGMLAIEAAGALDAVIMDDGLQNPSLAKDLSIAVLDGRRGIGNGRVIPAGPLRARLGFQLKLVDCVIVMGADAAEGEPSVLDDFKKRFHGPVLRGAVAPAGDTAWIADANMLAYAGIANPERFFRMLEGFAPRSIERRVFRDHHAFTEAEAARLIADAEASGALLVTTEKDLARLAGEAGARAELAARSSVLAIAVTFDERDLVRLGALVDGVVRGRG